MQWWQKFLSDVFASTACLLVLLVATDFEWYAFQARLKPSEYQWPQWPCILPWRNRQGFSGTYWGISWRIVYGSRVWELNGWVRELSQLLVLLVEATSETSNLATSWLPRCATEEIGGEWKVLINVGGTRCWQGLTSAIWTDGMFGSDNISNYLAILPW